MRFQQNIRNNHGAGEHRLIAFGGLQEIPKPAINPEKPAEPIAQHTDGTRAYARLQTMLKELADTEHLVAKDAVANFRAKLEAIRAKLQALDASRTEAIVALEKEAYADCSPYLHEHMELQLLGCRKIINPVLSSEKLECEFAGEKMSLTLSPSYQVNAVSVMGVTMPLRIPVDIKQFDAAVGNNLIDTLRLVAKRFDIKTLKLTASQTSIEWAVEGKEFVATPFDVLEVVQVPKPEDVQKYDELLAEERSLTERRSHLQGKLPLAVRNGDSTGADVLTADQKQAVEVIKQLNAQLFHVGGKMSELESIVSVRVLRTKDGTTVRENGSRNGSEFSWEYLDAAGKKQRKVSWGSGVPVEENTYEKEQMISFTRFSPDARGLPIMMKDLRANTEDYFTDKGQKSFRYILDPKDPAIKTDTLLYSSTGTLLDETALQAMTPEQIEAVFLDLLSREKKEPKNIVLQTCYSYAKYMTKCPRVKEIFTAVMQADPVQAFTMFEKYQKIPRAVEILQEAAYLLGDRNAVAKLIFATAATASLPDEEKQKIIDMSKLKQDYNAQFAQRYMQRDPLAQLGRFLQDPALQHLREVQKATESRSRRLGEVRLSWLNNYKDDFRPSHIPADKSYGWQNDVEQQLMVMIARNLYFQKKTVTPEAVMVETKRILDARKQYADIPLFAGRSVLHMANSEKVRDLRNEKGAPWSEKYYNSVEKMLGDTHRFGATCVRAAIEQQQSGGGGYSLLRPEVDREGLEIKAKILKAIRTLSPPSTFLFEGHGGPKGFYITGDYDVNGKNREAVYISAEELADAFTERARKFPQLKTDDPAKKDICVFSSCYSSNFVRAFYERLEGQPKPVTLAGAEYGQYGYNTLSSPLYNRFFSSVLKMNKTQGVSTFSDVFQNELSSDSNPSLYIPDESGQTMQISRNDTPSEPSNG